MADGLMAILGVAIGLAWLDFSTQLRPVTTPKGVEYDSFLLLVHGPVGTLALAASLVAFSRCVRFGRLPRPGEWIGLVVIVAMLAATTHAALQHESWRDPLINRRAIATALLGLAAAAVLLIALSPWRDRRWARTILVASLAFVLLCGPLAVVRSKLAMLQGRIYPDSGSMIGLPADASNSVIQPWMLAADGAIGLGLVPEGLVYAVPAMAVVRSFVRRRSGPRPWTEWAGVAIAAVLLFCWIQDGILIAGRVTAWSPWPELIVRAIWLGLVAGLGWHLTGRLAPVWQRWVVLDHPKTVASATDSPLD
jgi:hypothetical protein